MRKTFLSVLLVLPLSCSGNDLPRDLAAALVKEHGEFKTPYTVGLEIGGTFSASINPYWGSQPEGRLELLLRDLGYISVRGWPDFTMQLTPNGIEAAKHWFGDPNSRYPDAKRIPIAIRDLLELTGVTRQTQSVAAIEFRYEWRIIGAKNDLPTLILTNILPASERERLTSRHTGVAEASLYDDGWRVTKVGVEEPTLEHWRSSQVQ